MRKTMEAETRALLPMLDIQTLTHRCVTLGPYSGDPYKRTFTSHVIVNQDDRTIGRGRTLAEAWQDAWNNLSPYRGVLRK